MPRRRAALCARQRGSCFFFSSRRRHTRFDCDWSSDVCSSDLRYAVRINGMDTLAITKLDVLDACETVKICTGYRYQGDILLEFPEEERIWHEEIGRASGRERVEVSGVGVA